MLGLDSVVTAILLALILSVSVSMAAYLNLNLEVINLYFDLNDWNFFFIYNPLNKRRPKIIPKK